MIGTSCVRSCNSNRGQFDDLCNFKHRQDLQTEPAGQGEELQKSAHDRMDSMERHQSTMTKEPSKFWRH